MVAQEQPTPAGRWHEIYVEAVNATSGLDEDIIAYLNPLVSAFIDTDAEFRKWMIDTLNADLIRAESAHDRRSILRGNAPRPRSQPTPEPEQEDEAETTEGDEPTPINSKKKSSGMPSAYSTQASMQGATGGRSWQRWDRYRLSGGHYLMLATYEDLDRDIPMLRANLKTRTAHLMFREELKRRLPNHEVPCVEAFTEEQLDEIMRRALLVGGINEEQVANFRLTTPYDD